MKRFLAILVCSIMIFTGCTLDFLKPEVPLCPPDQQEKSLIYKFGDPSSIDFVMLLGAATYLDKYKGDGNKIDQFIKIVDKSIALVDTAQSYDIFSKILMDLLGPIQFVVVSPVLGSFKGVSLHITDCDKALILGHLVKVKQLAMMAK